MYALKLPLVLSMPHTRICVLSFSLILATMSGSSTMSFRDIKFPAAWTPLSVRAHLTNDDFFGSSALAFEMAPAATKALNRSPSMVFS